jgi:hypothetical protein
MRTDDQRSQARDVPPLIFHPSEKRPGEPDRSPERGPVRLRFGGKDEAERVAFGRDDPGFDQRREFAHRRLAEEAGDSPFDRDEVASMGLGMVPEVAEPDSRDRPGRPVDKRGPVSFEVGHAEPGVFRERRGRCPAKQGE